MDTPPPSDDPLLVEDDGHVRFLRLNRPEKKNALSDRIMVDLVRAVRAAAADDGVRVVGITGRGGAFSAGADLSPGNAADSVTDTGRPSGSRLDDIGSIGRLCLGIRVECDKPVVAGIDGIAIGAGLALAMCADMRIASTAARFHPGYARAGTSPDGGLSWTLPQAVGHEQAMRFLLEQEFIDAQAAQRLGMVGSVVPVDDFEDDFSAYCRRIASVAPIAARQTKRLVTRVGLPADLESHLRDELAYVMRGLSSEDGREAVSAILEKRAPTFTGR